MEPERRHPLHQRTERRHLSRCGRWRAPTPLTTLDPQSGEIGHLWPAFLPDGDHFFYLALTSGEGQDFGRNLYVSSVSAPRNRKLVARDASNAAFVPPHSLIFARDENLIVQHFDPDRLEISGSAVPLVPEPVAFNSNAALSEFTVSADGLLAFTVVGVQKTRLVLADRQGKARPLTDVGNFQHPSISPDGRAWLWHANFRIAHERNRPLRHRKRRIDAGHHRGGRLRLSAVVRRRPLDCVRKQSTHTQGDLRTTGRRQR